MRALVVAAVVALAVVALAVAPARADDRAAAEKQFRTGERLFSAGDFVHAAAAFEEAYATLPLPAIAFSAAQAYRLAWVKATDKDPTHLRRAVALYRAYVDQEPRGDRVVEASAALGDLEPLVARLGGASTGAALPHATGLTVTSAIADVQVAIDGAAPVRLPVVQELPVGTHVLVATAAGYAPRTQSVATLDGALVPVEIELDPLPARLMVSAAGGSTVSIDGRAVTLDRDRVVAVDAGRHFVAVTRRGRRGFAAEVEVARGQDLAVVARQPTTTQRRVARGILYGAGGLAVGAAVATTLAIVADHAAADLDAQRTSRGLTIDQQARYDDLRASRDTRRTVAVGLGVATAAAGVTGALLYWFDRDQPGAGLGLAPTVTTDGAGLTVAGHF